MYNERQISFLLSAVAGFIDTAGFIMLGGLFTAHVTGNLVLAGASLISANSSDAVNRLLMLPAFIVVVIGCKFISFYKWQNAVKLLNALLWSEFLFLLLFCLMGNALVVTSYTGMFTKSMFTVGLLGVTAMSIQNALMRLCLPTYLNTTVMTGNVTQYSIELAALIKSILRDGDIPVDKTKMRKFGTALIGFLSGAVAGAVGVKYAGLKACIIPCLIIVYIAINSNKLIIEK